MDIMTTIKDRRSCRAFLPQPVEAEKLERILDAARWCGSFVNSQPWEFAVLGGEVMKLWKDTLWDSYVNNVREEREYPMGPMPMPEPCAGRGDKFRETIDNTMFPPGIDNREARREAYTKSGVIVRDAPNAIIVYMERSLAQSPLHLMAAGGVMEAICLAAMQEGLSTCMMGRPVESPVTLRRILSLPNSKMMLSTVAIGYADAEAPINNMPRVRAELSESTKWYGF